MDRQLESIIKSETQFRRNLFYLEALIFAYISWPCIKECTAEIGTVNICHYRATSL